MTTQQCDEFPKWETASPDVIEVKLLNPGVLEESSTNSHVRIMVQHNMHFTDSGASFSSYGNHSDERSDASRVCSSRPSEERCFGQHLEDDKSTLYNFRHDGGYRQIGGKMHVIWEQEQVKCNGNCSDGSVELQFGSIIANSVTDDSVLLKTAVSTDAEDWAKSATNFDSLHPPSELPCFNTVSEINESLSSQDDTSRPSSASTESPQSRQSFAKFPSMVAVGFKAEQRPKTAVVVRPVVDSGDAYYRSRARPRGFDNWIQMTSNYFPAWSDPCASVQPLNYSNIASTNPESDKVQAVDKIEESKLTAKFHECFGECSAVRCAILISYYLGLWTFTGIFTWILLRLSLSVTSQGKYPYYMAANSFCMVSPGISFPGGNPEPGAVTEFGKLNNLADSLKASLKKSFVSQQTGRQSPSFRACGPATADSVETEVLMQPCNLTAFGNAMISQVDTILSSRPAVFIQIRRQLGYIPTTGKYVEVTCEAMVADTKLQLVYYSWSPFNSTLFETTKSGHVPTLYFPMLSEWHNAPGVLVSLHSSVNQAAWSGQRISIRCQANDGGSVKPPHREIILKVG